MPVKKVIIKFLGDGKFEIINSNKDVAVMVVYPDNTEATVSEGEKIVYEDRKDDDLPPPIQKRIEP